MGQTPVPHGKFNPIIFTDLQRAHRAGCPQERARMRGMQAQGEKQSGQRGPGQPGQDLPERPAAKRVDQHQHRGQAWRAVQAPAQDARVAQICRKTRVPLVPPNPNEFDSATRIGISRAVFGT